MKKLLIVLGILFFGFVAVLAALPTILSTQPVKNWALSQASGRMPGRLDIQSWSLGWLGGMECRGVKYIDPGHGIAVQVESITMSKGLLALIFDRENLGAVRIDRPMVDINLPAGKRPGDSGPPQLKGAWSSESGKKPRPQEGTPPAETRGATPMLPVLYGQLQIRQGALRTVGPDKHETLIIKDLDLVLDVAGAENPLSYRISFNAGHGTGKVNGEGTIVLPADDPLNLNAVESQAHLDIVNWDIEGLMAILAAKGRIPAGSGKINGHFNVSGTMKSGVKLFGQIKGSDIRFSGGPLKADTPHIKILTLDLEALKTMKSVTLNRVTLKSTLASATISGVIEPQGVSKVETTAQVDMAEVFAQFPQTLNLKRGTRILKGRIDLKAKVQSDGRTTNFDTRVHMDALEGIHGGKKLAWDAPITAEANGMYRLEGFFLEKFQVESAFLNGSGRGDLNDMQIELNADIQAALKELKKFVDLKGWTAAGKLKLNLHAGARPKADHFLSADLKIGDFILKQKKKILIPKNNLAARLNTDLQLDQDSRPSALHHMSLALHSWLGQSDIQLEQLSLNPDRGIQQAKGVVLDADLRLAYLATFLKMMNLLPDEIGLSGQSAIKVKGNFDGSQLNFTRVNLDAKRFVYKDKTHTIRDDRIRLDTKGTVDLKKRAAAFDPLVLETTTGNLRFTTLELSDWRDAAHTLSAKLSGEVDLGRTFKTIQGILPAQWQTAGQTVFNLYYSGAKQRPGSVQGKIKANSFFLKKDRQTLFPRGDVSIDLNSQIAFGSNNAPAELINTHLRYTARIGRGDLSFKRMAFSPKKAYPNIQGLMYGGTTNLANLSDLLKGMEVVPKDFQMTGQAEIQTQLALEQDIVALGETVVDISPLSLKTGGKEIKDGHLRIITRGRIDPGKRSVALAPLELTSDAGSFTFSHVTLPDWSKPENALRLQGKVKLVLAKLMSSYGALADLPQDLKISGRTTIDLSVKFNDPKQTLKLSGSVQSLRIDRLKENLLSEERIQIETDVGGSFGKQELAINRFDLSSTPISLKATGSIAPAGKGYQVDAKGSLALDLKLLSPHLKTLLDMDIEMAGKSKRSFAIKIMSTDGNWYQVLKTTDLTATLYAEKILAFGLSVQTLDVPVTIKKAIGRAQIQGAVKQGQLGLQPTVDFNVQPPLMSIPSNTLVLNRVVITESMAETLLAKIHPIFKGAAAVKGTVDLKLTHFNWPLSEAAQKDAVFAGVLKFNNVKLQTVGLVDILMTLMKAKEEEVYIGNKTVKFVGRNGRIECSPLRMRVKDTRLVLSGSVGFDQSLNYTAQIPVTRKLVGNAAFPYLKDTTLNIPIKGTVSKPIINEKSFASALENLIRQAGTKFIEEKAGDLLKKLFK